jgi:hypothetical protein
MRYHDGNQSCKGGWKKLKGVKVDDVTVSYLKSFIVAARLFTTCSGFQALKPNPQGLVICPGIYLSLNTIP